MFLSVVISVVALWGKKELLWKTELELLAQNLDMLDEEDEVCGWDELPPPKRCPRKHRELLRAIVSVTLGIGMRKVSLKELDRAYSIAFPKSTAINVNKKRGKR